MIPATPALNLLPDPSNDPPWSLNSSPLSSLFSGFPGSTPSMTFSNATYSGGNNYGLATAASPIGYAHPGQSYCLSMYFTIATPLTNAQAMLKLDFFDLNNNIIGGSSVQSTFSSTTNNAIQRVSVQGVAPSNAAVVKGSFGGIATVSGSNSGTINFVTPQLEPMWFSSVSYPTPDCTAALAACATMPDGTISRAVRVFSGFISDTQVTYDGPNRLWTITAAGPGALLENGLINGVFTSQYDTQILTSVIGTYFSTQISINAANSLAPNPLTQGALLSSESYTDNTLREVLNGLVDASGFVYYIDPYYRLYYQPAFFTSAAFQLTSATPDNVTTFNYYDYTLEYDGTQLKRRIKINGGQFQGSFQDVFSGNGSTKQFTLTLIPNVISSITVGGTVQHVGVYGRDTLGATYPVVVNKQSQYILFNTAPPNASNNVVVTYSYQAPITTQTILQTSTVVTPVYALPYFDAKVNDTNITDLTTATNRGLAEIVKFGSPLAILKFKATQFAPAGSSISFTSTLDGLVSTPIQVQQVTGTYLGNGINQFEYQCGTAYQPSLVDHIRNANKAVNRNPANVAAVTAIQQTDFVALESIAYQDSISATVQTQYATAVYGTGKYGQASYGGQTGTYGSARYGQSWQYG